MVKVVRQAGWKNKRWAAKPIKLDVVVSEVKKPWLISKVLECLSQRKGLGSYQLKERRRGRASSKQRFFSLRSWKPRDSKNHWETGRTDAPFRSRGRWTMRNSLSRREPGESFTSSKVSSWVLGPVTVFCYF